ncbi:MAG: hypothetical protein MUF01_01720 [Bryobacterales bacterium]|nr:hypothetical protein [Bryobacterales bacterium]
MTANAARCPLCNTRKAARACPARGDAICSTCCGQQREETIRCPFSCEYLREARKREALHDLDAATLPHRDIVITQQYLEDHARLGFFLGEALWYAAREEPQCVDADVREALAALIQSYRSLQSGLIYDARPSNPYAAGIASRVRARIAELEARLREHPEVPKPKDSDILGMLVFLQRTELQVANGRRWGRAFLDVLRQNHQPPDQPEPSAVALVG